jgi:hypothetical protein
MATRSRIARRNTDGTFTSIYCHWDGYPAGVGQTLASHYTEQDKVDSLIELGDLSSLGPLLGSKHSFGDDSFPDWTTAYGRDRGENCPPEVSPDLQSLAKLTRECGGEWLYVWNGHGWQAARGGIAFFGMPADQEPDIGGLESIEYWVQREARGE